MLSRGDIESRAGELRGDEGDDSSGVREGEGRARGERATRRGRRLGGVESVRKGAERCGARGGGAFDDVREVRQGRGRRDARARRGRGRRGGFDANGRG